MHLTILSRSGAIYTTRRLADAARIAGHRVRVLDPLQCELFLERARTGLYYRHRPLGRTDACIPRIAHSVQTYGLAVVDQLAQRGVALLNGARAIAQSRNKIRLLQHLAAQGVPVPATVMASDAKRLRQMVSLVGGCPVLIRLQQANDRMGAMVCETEQSMEAALEALFGMGHDLVVQQYVREAKGRDIRALVVGGRLVAAVRRQLRVGRLFHSLGAGGRFEAARLPERFARIAERTAQLVDLEVAAVDMLDLRDGPRVFDVNSSPGLQQMEEATGLDLAGAIVERAAQLARPPRRTAERLTARGPGATVRRQEGRGKR